MKKIKLLAASMLFASSVFGQTLYVPGGSSTGIGNNTTNNNVGIGTSIPLAPFDIKKSSPNANTGDTDPNSAARLSEMNVLMRLTNSYNSSGINEPTVIFDNGGTSSTFSNEGWTMGAQIAGSAYFRIGRYSGTGLPSNKYYEYFRINALGNAGFGTNSPTQKLHVAGNAFVSSKLGVAVQPNNNFDITSGRMILGTEYPGSNPSAWSTSGYLEINNTAQYGYAMRVLSKDPYTKVFASHLVNSAGTPQEVFYINANGSTTIGLRKPTGHSDAMLSVDGKIVAQSIYCRPNTEWADYVFESNYKLKPLSEVEQFVKVNKHLPEVPSAKEVEDKGVNVGDMNAVLLKKIEELTLYMIELEKKNEKLTKDMQKLLESN